MKRSNEENYNFSPWKQFFRIVQVVVVLALIALMYALAAIFI